MVAGCSPAGDRPTCGRCALFGGEFLGRDIQDRPAECVLVGVALSLPSLQLSVMVVADLSEVVDVSEDPRVDQGLRVARDECTGYGMAQVRTGDRSATDERPGELCRVRNAKCVLHFVEESRVAFVVWNDVVDKRSEEVEELLGDWRSPGNDPCSYWYEAALIQHGP